MISFKSGNFEKTLAYLNKMKKKDATAILERYGSLGVKLLSDATPVRTGTTASSWSYKVTKNGERYELTWTNSNVVNGVSIAFILQYGHGTRNGGYVKGLDYINPATRKVFEEMTAELRKEVSNV